MKRPEITKEIIEEAARKIVTAMGLDEEHVADIVEVYNHSWRMDGYEIAKALDDEFHWHIDMDAVVELDGIGSLIEHLHREACRQWVQENDIQPPYPVGSQLTKGVVTGISDFLPAYYLVQPPDDADSSGRLLIRFEDAVLAVAVA